jgi:predicted nucleic acid-binding protein
MSNRHVLVDTSVWVPYLRGNPQDLAHPIRLLGEEDRLATNWLIRVELLSGAASDQDYAILADQLKQLHQLAMSDEAWSATARLRWLLHRKGILVPVVDVAIASSAIVADCELLAVDRHFDIIAKHAPLKIYPHNGKRRR